jgi:hypothetical protein
MRTKTIGRWALRGSVAAALVAALVGPTAATPASAGVCYSPGCGGEVTNNARMSILITNCWKDTYGTWEPGDHLDCVPVANRGTWDARNADVELLPTQYSTYAYYYYDVDAIRFYRNCVTKYHFWGGSQQTEDRRGKSSIWRKIYDPNHVYIDSISCG